MSNSSYWERRKAREMFRYMESAEQTANEISKLYLKASRYLSIEMDAIFERFQTKHKLSEEEAYRLLNSMQDKTSLDELKAALKSGNSDKTKAELLAELESPAYQARLERLKRLQNQIDLTMHQVYGQEKIKNTSHYVDLANEAYYRSIFNIQQQTGFGFSFALTDPAVIDKVINSRWSGADYSSRIWKNTSALAQDLKEELLLSLVTGRTDRETAEIIANKFGQGAGNARRLVRTESCNLANQMDMISYEECGIDKYRFVATLDLRTSTVCRDLDGKVFRVSDQQPGVNCPPMHPWCRSTTICDISASELTQMERRARDPVTGKTVMVPADMTYSQWYEKNVRGNPEAVKKAAMWNNRYDDNKQYDKYRHIFGKDMPESFDKFQDMKYNHSEKWNSLKAEKQVCLNKMDFKDMGEFVGKLGNKETRLWYKVHDEMIPDLIDPSKPLKEQAIQAFEMRNTHRTQARDLMKDQVARAELDRSNKNPTFEEIIEHKMKKYGLSNDEAYSDIIRSSATTNKKYDKIAGVEGQEAQQ